MGGGMKGGGLGGFGSGQFGRGIGGGRADGRHLIYGRIVWS